MDSVIGAIVGKLLELGVTEELFLVFVFLIFTYTILHRFFRPLKEKVKQVPTKDYHIGRERIHEDDKRVLHERLDSIEENLNKLQRSMTDSGFNTKMLLKETEKINQELQQVRSIVSQFHGHLMYGRSDIFGNREIR